MKKIFLHFFICGAAANIASAQNVGIGTPAPLFKLDVRNGSINTDSVYRIGNATVLSVAGTQNLLIGRNTGLLNAGIFNTFCGNNAGLGNTTGFDNSFFGYSAGNRNTKGRSNSFFGAFTGDDNTTGIENSFFGTSAGTNNSTGSLNTFFGFNSGGQNSIGSNNSFFGRYAGAFNTTGEENSFFGTSAGENNTGSSNSFFGSSAGLNNTGGSNSFFGKEAGANNTNGHSNSYFGYRTGNDYDESNYNTFLGYQAGALGTRFELNGDNNTFIGAYASGESTFGYFNQTAIGYRAQTTGGNQVRIGNSDVTSIGGIVGWSILSDGRFKRNIRENVPGLQFIMLLKPITYTLDKNSIKNFLYKNVTAPAQNNETDNTSFKTAAENNSIIYSGFFAQDVEAAAKKTGYNFSGVDLPKNENDFYSLRYAEFVVPLVKAVQEQQKLIEQLTAEVKELKKKIKN